MRLKWDERAKRLAKEHNMVDEIESSLGSNACVAMGVEDCLGEMIRWSIKDGTVIVETS